MKNAIFGLTFASALLLSASAGPITVDLDKKTVKKANYYKYGYDRRVTDDTVYHFPGPNEIPTEADHPYLSSFVIDLVNEHEIAYLGPMYIGTPRAFANINYDSGSAALPAAGVKCDTCQNTFYDPDVSSTAVFEKTGQLNYGSAHLEGSFYTDTVSLDDGEHPIPGYEVFSIEYAEGLQDMYGILGLSPESPFVVGLKAQGFIDSAIAGYKVDAIDSPSQVIFGGYDDTDFLQTPVEFPLLHPTVNKAWWQVAISEAAYNGKSILEHGNSAIFDTGTSLISVPYKDLQNLAGFLAEDSSSFNCAAGTCYAFGHCDTIAPTLSPITFRFGTNDEFHITPEEYLLNGSDLGVDLPVCYVGIAGGVGSSMYIMGDSFLRSHYQIYDYENLTVSIARTRGNHSPLFLK